jgi:hypothetical protein
LQQTARADLARIAAWVASSSPLIEDSAFWREFGRSTDLSHRLRMLQVWAERRPSAPLVAPGKGRRMPAARLRVLVTIAFLRGVRTPAGLAPVSRRWTWAAIADLAVEYAEQAGDTAEEWAAFEDEKTGERVAIRAFAEGLHEVWGVPSDLPVILSHFLGSVARSDSESPLPLSGTSPAAGAMLRS